MNIKSYFEFEVRTTTVYAVLAVAMGYVSFVINHTAYATVAALFVLVAATVLMRFAWKIKEGAKWWLGNGAIAYLVLWMIIWTVFYNTYAVI